jgi:phosphatidylserine decarboxylase
MMRAPPHRDRRPAPEGAGLLDHLLTLPQYLAPQHLLSRLAGTLARSERPWVSRRLIRTFIRRYPLDMAEAVEPDPAHYRSLNALFTRRLRPGARPMPADPLAVVSPADGTTSEFGTLAGERLLQAKGRSYTIDALLGGDPYAAQQFYDGAYATVYLAPHNYHRVHAPCAGRVQDVVFVPGTLFSVNPRTARSVPGVFARNERVILHCAGERGPFVVVMIGAMLVGSMSVTCCDLGPIVSQRPKSVVRQPLARPYVFARGDELGHFNMGSTVVVAFHRSAVRWDPRLTVGTAVRVGQPLGAY